MSQDTIEHLIAQRFNDLSLELKKAARFVIDNPDAVALHSMRAVAAKAQVHPNTMLRLVRALGFESYDPFRQRFRTWIVNARNANWLGRAETLRRRSPESPKEALVEEFTCQELQNIQQTFNAKIISQIVRAAEIISSADRIYILGLRSLFPVAFYVNYACQMFTNKTVLMTGIGGTFADELRNIDRADVMIAFSYRPYARDAVRAVDFARERGARVVVVTDSNVAPVVGTDSVPVIVSNTSSSLFPTIVPALAVAQALTAILVSQATDDIMAEIARSEGQLDRFGVYVE